MSVNVPEQLPEPRRADRRAGRELCTISLEVEVVTPILGGASQTRELDDVDVMRVPTVRGHLRFWWRALCGLASKELHVRESELWGRAATDDAASPARSPIQIRAEVLLIGKRDQRDVVPYDSSKATKTVGAYALWPARAAKPGDPAPRRDPGTRVRIVVVAPREHEVELRNVIRAWLVFGGIRKPHPARARQLPGRERRARLASGEAYPRGAHLLLRARHLRGTERRGGYAATRRRGLASGTVRQASRRGVDHCTRLAQRSSPGDQRQESCEDAGSVRW